MIDTRQINKLTPNETAEEPAVEACFFFEVNWRIIACRLGRHK